MNVLKNVYKVIMALTIIAILIPCLQLFGAIKTTSETGSIVISISSILLVTSVFFSRNANIIANRKNNNIAWIVTSLLLIYVIISILPLIFKDFALPSAINLIINVIMIALAVIILIFEIPQANTSHGHFQKFIVVLVIITCALGYTVEKKSDDAKKELYETYDYSAYKKEIEEIENINKFFYLSLYITVGAFLINPMLRVHYLDIDYSNAKEIDDIIINAANRQTTTVQNPNAVLQQTHKPEVPKTPVALAPVPIEPVKEIPTEKVINPNFKQDDLPEAIIPSLNLNGEQVTQTPEVTEIAPNPEVSASESVTLAPTPEVVTTQVPETQTVSQPETLAEPPTTQTDEKKQN